MKRPIIAGIVGIATIASCADAQTLEGFARLPADTFATGPTSGQFIAATNGRVPPFAEKQPVQGFSSILQTAGGEFLAMCDNGFGAQDNSADYVLRFYRIAPNFRTRIAGTGSIDVKSFVSLRDPDRRVNFPIVAERETYYPTSAIPVAPEIREGRLLSRCATTRGSWLEAPAPRPKPPLYLSSSSM